MTEHQCSTPTKKGRPCPFNADRVVSGAWFCHVHDPDGLCQAHLRDQALDRASPRTPKGKNSGGPKTVSRTRARRRAWKASSQEHRQNWMIAGCGKAERPTVVAEAPLTTEDKYRWVHNPPAPSRSLGHQRP